MRDIASLLFAALAFSCAAAPYQDSPGVEKTRRGEMKSSDSVVTDVSFRQMAEPYLNGPLVSGGATNPIVRASELAAAVAPKQDALTEAQSNAVNSGVTSGKVAEWDALKSSKQDALTEAQSNAVDSGVTSAQVSKWNGYDSAKQDRLTEAQMRAVDSGVDAGRVTNYEYVVSHFSEKQDALTDPQVRAVNSGITANDVLKLSALLGKEAGYDSHLADGGAHVTAAQKAEWSGKQDALTPAQTNAVDSGVTSGKVSSYDLHLSDGDVHVTAAQKSEWSGKQAALTGAQLGAVDSGVTSGKVSSYDSHLSDGDVHVTAALKAAWNGYGPLIGELQATKVDADDVYTKGEIELVVLRNLVQATITNHLSNLTWDGSYHVMWKKRADAGCFYETAYTNVNVLVEGNP